MGAYIFKRVLSSFITLWLISFFAFLFIAILPGNPAEIMLGEFATPEKVARVTRQWGLDKPILYRYGLWLGNVFQGDFGESIFSRVPTLNLLKSAWPASVELCLLSIAFASLLGIPVGLYAAIIRPAGQRLLMGGILIAQSIPSYVSALILILIVCSTFRLLPASGYVPFIKDPLTNIKVMLLPTISLGLVISAFIARFTRSCMLDALGEDFVRTARSKGLRESAVVLKHGFRSALIPVISLIGTQLVWFLGGAIIQEIVFVIPGLGRLIVRSVMNRDYAVIQAVILLVAVVAALGNLVVDLAYGALDPRIRYE